MVVFTFYNLYINVHSEYVQRTYTLTRVCVCVCRDFFPLVQGSKRALGPLD
jgi:hypothetical protein